MPATTGDVVLEADTALHWTGWNSAGPMLQQAWTRYGASDRRLPNCSSCWPGLLAPTMLGDDAAYTSWPGGCT